MREYNYIMQPLIHFIWCNNLMKNKLNIEADYIRGSWNLREKYHRLIYRALVSVCGDNILRNFILKEESQIGQWSLWSLLIPFLLEGMEQNDKIRNHLITFLSLSNWLYISLINLFMYIGYLKSSDALTATVVQHLNPL